MSGPTPSLQFSWDGPGAGGAGQDGQALLWSQAQGKFVYGSAGISDHGGLSGLSDDDHGQYALLAPAASTRNVIQPTGAAVVPFILKGASAQTGDLLQWQNSGGTVLGRVRSSGELQGPNANDGFVRFATNELRLGAWAAETVNLSTSTTILPYAASNQALIVKGRSSQTANLQEWQNSSGTVLASVSAAGALSVPSGGVGGTAAVRSATAATTAAIYFTDGGGGYGSLGATNGASWLDWGAGIGGLGCRMGCGVLITEGGANTIPLTVQTNAAGQTSSLTEWRNSSGTVVASVGPTGGVTINPTSATVKPLLLKAAAAQTANLLEAITSASAVQFAIGPEGRIKTNQTAANTNTPSGATAKQLPLYDEAGTLLGYVPVYAAPW